MIMLDQQRDWQFAQLTADQPELGEHPARGGAGQSVGKNKCHFVGEGVTEGSGVETHEQGKETHQPWLGAIMRQFSG